MRKNNETPPENTNRYTFDFWQLSTGRGMEFFGRLAALTACCALGLSACGGNSTPAPASAPVVTYSIGGTVTGLHGLSMSLQNGTDSIDLTGDGTFTFPTQVASGNDFAVTVNSPFWTRCVVSNGSGTVSANVTTVNISCSPITASSMTFVGSGFMSPFGLAVDASDNIYVADYDARTITKVSADNLTMTPMGGVFSHPGSLVVDASGNLYVPDLGNANIQKYDAGAGTWSLWAAGPTFNTPSGVDMDAGGNIYLADWANSYVKKIAPDGLSETPFGSGIGSPYDVALDRHGNVYVPDISNHAIKKIAPDGTTVTTLATGIDSGGVAVDAYGNVYVTDFSTNSLLKITPDGQVDTILGTALNSPYGIAIDSSGNLYVADHINGLVKRFAPVL